MKPQSSYTNRAIKAQMALKAVSNKDFADVVGLSLSALYTRFNDYRGWKVDELAKAAEYFEVSILTFFPISDESKSA